MVFVLAMSAMVAGAETIGGERMGPAGMSDPSGGVRVVGFANNVL